MATATALPDVIASPPTQQQHQGMTMPNSPPTGRIGMHASRPERSALYCPVPTKIDPTEVLVRRFTGSCSLSLRCVALFLIVLAFAAWRNVLKDFIVYFKTTAAIEENRAKDLTRLSNSLVLPLKDDGLLLPKQRGGIQDLGAALHTHNRQHSLAKMELVRAVENNIVSSLETLRNDLKGKMNEIKALSDDFRNDVDKEREASRKHIAQLSEAIEQLQRNPKAPDGKKDPYLLRIQLERQLRKHIAEENYLHQAFLNIEKSGRSLEEVIIRTINTSFRTYQALLRQDADTVNHFASLMGPIGAELPLDKEWNAFMKAEDAIIEPTVPLRRASEISFYGHNHPTAQPICSGILERKSKYLRSYTSAYYVLTRAGFLHELHEKHHHSKSQSISSPSRGLGAEKVYDSTPVMSLFIPDCTLGEKSAPNSGKFTFVLRGRESKGLHRGHSWVFKAGTWEGMMQWYGAILSLTQVEDERKGGTPSSGQSAQVQGQQRMVDAEEAKDVVPMSLAPPTTQPRRSGSLRARMSASISKRSLRQSGSESQLRPASAGAGGTGQHSQKANLSYLGTGTLRAQAEEREANLINPLRNKMSSTSLTSEAAGSTIPQPIATGRTSMDAYTGSRYGRERSGTGATDMTFGSDTSKPRVSPKVVIGFDAPESPGITTQKETQMVDDRRSVRASLDSVWSPVGRVERPEWSGSHGPGTGTGTGSGVEGYDRERGSMDFRRGGSVDEGDGRGEEGQANSVYAPPVRENHRY
ncbi:phosphatidylinositol 4,5-bisphosphate-binding protein [Saitoella coloradoensis]